MAKWHWALSFLIRSLCGLPMMIIGDGGNFHGLADRFGHLTGLATAYSIVSGFFEVNGGVRHIPDEHSSYLSYLFFPSAI